MPALWIRHSPASASLVRESLCRSLAALGALDDEAYDASLLLSELVGNAVRHAPPLPSGHVAVRWSLEHDGCRIAVTDGGTDKHLESSTPGPGDTSGRGLAIVEALSESWGVETADSATTVWAVYRFRSLETSRNLVRQAS